MAKSPVALSWFATLTSLNDKATDLTNTTEYISGHLPSIKHMNT